jgi:hypothetical protein
MNYMEKITKALDRGTLEPHMIMFISVEHDDKCQLLKNNGECNCNCDVSFPTDTGVAYIQKDGSLKIK